MSFSGVPFLCFLAVFLVLYGLCPPRYRRYLLPVGSVIFIALGSWKAALWALLFTAANYVLGVCIQRTAFRKLTMALAVAVDGLALVTFKLLGVGMLGLSYYLFSFMAYLVEVYRGTVQAELDPVRFASFGFFFPKFTMGPITRYSELGPQLDKSRISAANIQKGLQGFTLGFILKLLVADKLGVFFGEGYHALKTVGYDAISTELAWLGVVVTSLHIYIEWIAYMYMALGIARMLGFQLPENFNYPYIARTVGDYYRRWPMTLTRWFKDFIYIPLGGSRRGLARTVVNVLFVWLLTSLWHGVGLAPNYLIWGMSIGVMIVLERLWKTFVTERFRVGAKLGDGLPGKLWKLLVSLLAHIWVVVPMILSWLVFTIKDLDQLGLYFSRLFPAAGSSAGADPADFAKNWELVGPAVVVGVIFCLPVLNWLKALLGRFELGRRVLRFMDSRLAAWIVSAVLAGLFWYAVFVLTQKGSDPMGYAAF